MVSQKDSETRSKRRCAWFVIGFQKLEANLIVVDVRLMLAYVGLWQRGKSSAPNKDVCFFRIANDCSFAFPSNQTMKENRPNAPRYVHQW
jgi:hypothetical protein